MCSETNPGISVLMWLYCMNAFNAVADNKKYNYSEMLYTDMSDIDYQLWLPACTLGSQASYASTGGEANQQTSVDAGTSDEEVIDEELGGIHGPKD
jgi:hypothetical protein